MPGALNLTADFLQRPANTWLPALGPGRQAQFIFTMYYVHTEARSVCVEGGERKGGAWACERVIGMRVWTHMHTHIVCTNVTGT